MKVQSDIFFYNKFEKSIWNLLKKSVLWKIYWKALLQKYYFNIFVFHMSVTK